MSGLDFCDSPLDMSLLFAQHRGALGCWDPRMVGLAWHAPFPSGRLGSPSCLAAGVGATGTGGRAGSGGSSSSPYHFVCGTLAGTLLLFDLRYLQPVRLWQLSSGGPILDCAMLGRGTSVGGAHYAGPFAACAVGGDGNTVAIFDTNTGATVSLFESRSSSGQPVSLPQLVDVSEPLLLGGRTASSRIDVVPKGSPSRTNVAKTMLAPTSLGPTPADHARTFSGLSSPEQISAGIRQTIRSESSVRSLFLVQNSKNFAAPQLFMAGSDRRVRLWSLANQGVWGAISSAGGTYV